MGRVRRTRLSIKRSAQLRRRCHEFTGTGGVVSTVSITNTTAKKSNNAKRGTSRLVDHTLQRIDSISTCRRHVTRVRRVLASVSGLLDSFGRRVSSCLSKRRFSSRIFCRARGELSRVGRLGSGCKGAIRRVLRTTRRGAGHVTMLRSCSGCLGSLLASVGQGGRRLSRLYTRISKVQGGTTGKLAGTVTRTLRSLGFLSIRFAVRFQGARCDTKN